MPLSPENLPAPPPPLARRPLTPQQTSLIAIILAVTIGAIVYRLLQQAELSHTALLFMGLPAVLAIVLSLTPPARSATGGILKGLTLFLLIVAPLLGEGMVCILFAAPIFYTVGIVIGVIMDHFRRKRAVTAACVSVLLLPMCLEGVVPGLTVSRQQSVSVTRVVAAPAAMVERSLAASPRLAQPMPWLLRLGFPVPLAVSGTGLAPGDTRTLRFSGVEGHAPGNLRLQVTRRGAGFAEMRVTEDDSKLDSWLHWQGSSASWHAVDDGHTAVTWTMTYDRQLDPAWYFGPLERETMREAAAYMIAANARPASGAGR